MFSQNEENNNIPNANIAANEIDVLIKLMEETKPKTGFFNKGLTSEQQARLDNLLTDIKHSRTELGRFYTGNEKIVDKNYIQNLMNTLVDQVQNTYLQTFIEDRQRKHLSSNKGKLIETLESVLTNFTAQTKNNTFIAAADDSLVDPIFKDSKDAKIFAAFRDKPLLVKQCFNQATDALSHKEKGEDIYVNCIKAVIRMGYEGKTAWDNLVRRSNDSLMPAIRNIKGKENEIRKLYASAVEKNKENTEEIKNSSKLSSSK